MTLARSLCVSTRYRQMQAFSLSTAPRSISDCCLSARTCDICVMLVRNRGARDGNAAALHKLPGAATCMCMTLHAGSFPVRASMWARHQSSRRSLIRWLIHAHAFAEVPVFAVHAQAQTRQQRPCHADTSVGLWMAMFDERYLDDRRTCGSACKPAGIAFYRSNEGQRSEVYGDVHGAHKMPECSAPTDLAYLLMHIPMDDV